MLVLVVGVLVDGGMKKRKLPLPSLASPSLKLWKTEEETGGCCGCSPLKIAKESFSFQIQRSEPADDTIEKESLSFQPADDTIEKESLSLPADNAIEQESPEPEEGATNLLIRTDEEKRRTDEEKRSRKATKSDDAAVPTHLSMEHLCDGNPFGWGSEVMSKLNFAIQILQGFLLRVWKRRLTRSFVSYLKRDVVKDMKVYPLPVTVDCDWKYHWTQDGAQRYRIWWMSRWVKGWRDINPGRDALTRGANSSWWGWEDGSHPFFWRWPQEYVTHIQDGIRVYAQRSMPLYKKAQKDITDELVKERVIKKLNKVRRNRYIQAGYIKSLTSFLQSQKVIRTSGWSMMHLYQA